MSDRNDDGHSPYTCNWIKCEAESDVPCPFLKPDKPVVEYGPVYGRGDSEHEHRYTVPVEWETKLADEYHTAYDTTHAIAIAAMSPVSVTKLRCESCESEVERS